MSQSQTISPGAHRERGPIGDALLDRVRVHYRATREIRRGVCLLNAREYEKAAVCFDKATALGAVDRSLPSYLAACLVGQGRHADAARALNRTSKGDRSNNTVLIRQALLRRAAGCQGEAVAMLRDGLRCTPECAELHFQLGTLLTSMGAYEEAELRFTQAVNIDRNHTAAFVSLAMCCGVRGAPGEALSHLERAQQENPHDARIGSLLAQAARAHQQAGRSPNLRVRMPDEELESDVRGIEELSRVIEAEPDFVDAFLCIPEREVDRGVFAMLLQTIRSALERQPEHAELHYHCGRVLERLGRDEDAILANERAVTIDPRFTRALIELGKLYQRTARTEDATTRLEQAVTAGAEYADVYFLLGRLYQERGEVGRARSAYRRALLINDRYEAALEALASLPD